MGLFDRLTSRQRGGSAASEAALLAELLRAVVENTPVALVLLTDAGTVAFTNGVAREMFFEGQDVDGSNFLAILAKATEALRRALLAEDDHIFTFGDDTGFETFHLSRRQLDLAGRPHTLLAVRHMTSEISRAENEVLKKTLRIMQHEFANTLGPASSLLRTARQIVDKPEHLPKLAKVLTTVEERLAHLEGFLGGLARFGKLPQPRKALVAWASFLDGLRALMPSAQFSPPPPGEGWFDPGQIEQVVINLVKNAHEAGGPAGSVWVEIDSSVEGAVLAVLDRGSGMTDEVMQNALLPSFTTKPTGSGMGLTLCREIVEAHLGRLKISRRPGGGTAVTIWLPPREAPLTRLNKTRAKLTLTRS